MSQNLFARPDRRRLLGLDVGDWVILLASFALIGFMSYLI